MKDAEFEQARELSTVPECSTVIYSVGPQFTVWFDRRLSTKASKQCQSLPVLLFMVVNSTSLSAALINLTDPGHSKN